MQEGDAYAFGVLLYELYSGQPAWAGLSTGDIISAKLRTHASQALRMSADAPPALQVPYLSLMLHLQRRCITVHCVDMLLSPCNLLCLCLHSEALHLQQCYAFCLLLSQNYVVILG